MSKMDLKAVNYTRNSILMFERVLNTPVGVMLLALAQLYWQVATQLTFSCSKSKIKTLTIKTCEICEKLTIKTPERHQRWSLFFIKLQT